MQLITINTTVQSNLMMPLNNATARLNNGYTLLTVFLKKSAAFGKKALLPFGISMIFLLSGVAAIAQCSQQVEGAVLTASTNPICSGQMTSINISVSPGTGGTYSGTFTNDSSFTGLTPIANTIKPTYTFTNNTTGNTTVYFELRTLTFNPSAGGICPASSSTISGNTTVTIQPVANLNAMLTTQPVLCNNGGVSINVSNPNGVGGTYNRSTNYNGAGHIASNSATGQAYGTFTDVLTNSTASPINVIYTFTPISPGSGCVGTPVNVTVTINPNPTIVCPANKIQSTDNNACTAVVTGINPVSFAPATCNGTASTFSYTLSGATTMTTPVAGSASGATFNKGVTTVTYTVRDAANNTGTCSFTVTVNDTQGPTFSNTLQTDINVNSSSDGTGNCGAVVTYPPYTATDNCGGTVIITYSQNSGTSFPVGTTTVTVTATDNANPANTTTDQFTVTVVDNENPTISCPPNITINNANDACGAIANFAATAMDNCPSGVVINYSQNPGTVFPVGTTTVTVTATDAAGNSSIACTFTVTVVNVGGIYVNDAFTGSDIYTSAVGSDATGTGTKCAPFATIAKAISVASTTDTIYVDGGSYTENVSTSKNITFKGANAGVPGGATRIAESLLNAPTTGQLITLSGSNVSVILDGLKIDGQNVAVITDASQNLTIRNTVAELDFVPGSNNLYSIGATLTLDRNLFKAIDGTNDGSSSHIFSGSPSLSVTNNTFTSVDAIDNLTGSTTSLPVWLNITTGTNSALVTGNSFNKIDIGILLADNASNVNITNNDFIEAKRKAYTGGTSFGAGIALFGNLTGTNLNVLNNNFTNSETGIRTSTGDASNTLPAYGVLKVNRNSFTTITDTSVRIGTGYTGILDATCNWFGTIGAGAIDATTSNQVVYTPYLLSGTDDNPAAPGFQTSAACGTGNDIYVNDGSQTGDRYTTAIGNDATGNGTPTAPYLTIQKAISAAALGDSIYVDAGIYSGFMTVNKTVSITGAQAGVDPRPTGTGVRPGMFGESIVLPPSVDTTNEGGTLFTLTANNTAFDGFTFSGNNPAVSGGQPVNGVNIQASRVLVNLQAPITSITGLNFKNNVVKNFYRTGVYLYGAGPAAPQQNNVVDKNVFDNIHRLSGTATAVYLEQESTSDVTNNLMTRVGRGAFTATISGNATVPFSFSNNNITSYFTGIWVNNHYGATPVCTVAGNTLATEAGAMTNDGIRITSMLTSAQVLVSNNVISPSRFGYYLWNCPTTNTIKLSGGSVTGGSRGINASNIYPGFVIPTTPSTYIINNVNLQNSTLAGMFVDDNPANMNASATVALSIQNNTVVNNAATGLLIRGAGATASFTGATPAAFTGQAKYIDLTSNGMDAPAVDINATAVSFGGQTGANSTLAQNFDIEDKIDHKIDSAQLGFVLVKANNTYVTPASFIASGTTEASVQRAADAAGAGFTVNVKGGTYNGLINVAKNLNFEGAALGVAGTGTRPATESVLIVPASGTSLITLSNANTSASFNGFKFDGTNLGNVTDPTQNLTIANSIAELDFVPNSNNLYSGGNSLTLTRNLFKAIDGTNNGASSHIFSSAKTLTVIGNNFTSADAINDLNTTTTSLPVWLNVSIGTTGALIDSNAFNKIDIGVLVANDASNVNITNNDFIEAKRKAYTNGTSFGAGVALFGNLTGTNLNILNNNFTNSETGIRTSTGDASNTLPAYGVLKVNRNSFTSITDTSVRIGTGYTGTLDATCNWWGTTSTNAIDATTSNQVVYIPYLLSGTDNSTARGFQTTANCNGTPVVITNTTTTPRTCSGNGSFTVTFNGGTGPYSLTYTGQSTGGPTAVTSPATISNLDSGTYNVTITDANGTFTTTSVIITYNPVTNTNTGISYTTIQGAIDAATTTNGHILQVCAGRYADSINVSKSLTILGPNASVIPCSGTRAAEAVILPIRSQPFYDGTTEVRMMQITANNVTIKGLTFDGDNAAISGGTPSDGANIDAADGIDIFANVQNITVQNNIFKNMNETGVQAYPSGSVSLQNNTITNNQFVNIAGNFDAAFPLSGYGVGVLVYNNFYATVDNNCMTNARIGVQTGNFNLAGSRASISNNIIESKAVGVWYNLHYQSASNWTITGNNLTTRTGATTNTGVFVSSILSGVSGTITNNNVTGAKWGVELWNNPTTNPITISGGTLTNCETGVFANDFDSYLEDGATSNYTISGMNITSNVVNNIGIHVKDNSVNSTPATTTVQIQNSTITSTVASSTGMLVTGGRAFASFTGTGTPAAFTGQTKYIDLTGNGADAPATGIIATAVTFDGLTGGTATNAQNWTIEDKIDHKIDSVQLGFVLVKANNTFVTPNSFIAPGTPDAKIQRGVDAAGTTGFTLNVQANSTAIPRYADNVTVNKEIIILGPNNAINPNTGTRITEAVVVPATNNLADVAGRVFNITANNVTVKGFSVDGDNPAISGGTAINGADINASAGIATGVYPSTNGNSNTLIENNVVRNFDNDISSTGAIYGNGSQSSAIAGNKVLNNKIDNSTIWGVLTESNWYADIQGNTITRSNRGIQADGYFVAAPTVTTISGNTVGYYKRGITINNNFGNASQFAVSNNTIATEINGSNEDGGTGPATVNRGIAVWSMFSGTAGVTTSGNTINILNAGTNTNPVSATFIGEEFWNIAPGKLTSTADAIRNAGTGVLIQTNHPTFGAASYGSFASIAQDSITGSLTDGILLTDNNGAGGPNAQLSLANTFVTGGTNSIRITSADIDASTAINNNSLTGASAKTIDAGAYTGTTSIAATCNWYGSNDLGIVASKIQGLVTYMPYLNDGTDAQPAIRGFQPAAGTCVSPTKLYVNDGSGTGDGYTTNTGSDATGNGSTIAPFATITKALTIASTADTIFVDAGSYFEEVAVNKEVTIKGLDSSKTIVYPATSNPVGSGGTLGGNTIFLVRANNVTIRDITVDGNNPNIGVAVDARNGIVTDFSSGDYTSLVVHHTIVKNIYNRGIYSTYGSTPGNTFSFHHNTVTNVQGTAASIAILNIGNSGIIDSNKVSNANDGIVANQSTGTIISNNIVSGSGIHTDNNGGSGGLADTLRRNMVSNVGTSGYGILVFLPSRNVIVEENTISSSYIAIANVGQGAPGITPVFRKNTIDGQNIANSTGVFQTTSIPGPLPDFAPSNVSGTYLNNFIRNNQQGFYLKHEAGFTSTIEAHENSITGNPTSVAIAVGPDGAGTLTNNFSCNWFGGSNPVVTGGTLNAQPTLINGTDNQPTTPGFQPVPGSCGNCVMPDVVTPTITLKPNPTVFLTSNSTYTIQLSDVLQSVTDNCDPNPSANVNTLTVNCSNVGANGNVTTYQPFIANSATGNQNAAGEQGMDFRVNTANGIVITQLGAFDHQGNGLIGTQPDANGNFGIRVAIFNKANQSIVPGLDVVITGNGDAFAGNYRYKNIPTVTLPPGDYLVLAKGYNANELNGNSYIGGGPYPQGDNAGGAISFLNTVFYDENDAVAGFTYPSTMVNTGTSSVLKSGTFTYALNQGNTVTVTATDASGNQSVASATVTVMDTMNVLTTKNITVNLNSSGQATIQPADVLQSFKNKCGIDVTNSTLQVSPSSFNCSNIGASTLSAPYQPFVANSATGNQNAAGEQGMDFRVNAASGIVITQLGAFDHQGNGITGTQSGGIRVAIFNKATQAIVPGLDAVIVGNGDVFAGNYRYKNIPAVTLPPGDYLVLAKGYNANELSGNSYLGGGPYPQGDNAGGAISFLNTVFYDENDAVAGFTYPSTMVNTGTSSVLKSGTFTYSTRMSSGTPVTLTATDGYGNQKQATASVTLVDNNGPVIITKNITVALDNTGTATITPNDVLQSPVTDNCGVNTASIAVSPNSFSCADYSSNGGSATTYQPFIANSATGNQNAAGEQGMDFRVNAANGIVITQLGAFDHQGNGITGTQPDANGNFGIRVAIFNKANQSIVPGLDVVITGNGDAFSGNYRYRNIPSVTLPPGDYLVLAKGYNANELNGNSYIGGGPYPQGDNAGGAISFLNTVFYDENDAVAGFTYPSTMVNTGTSSVLKSGTFTYALPVSNNKIVTVTATDVNGNIAQQTAIVTLTDPNNSCTAAPVMAGATKSDKADVPVAQDNVTVTYKVYPNPSTGQFTIQLLNVKVPKVTLQIMDVNGKMVEQKVAMPMSKTATLSIPVDISRQAPGMYIVKIITADGVQTTKVVVSR